jgi:hypothetical protein
MLARTRATLAKLHVVLDKLRRFADDGEVSG